jgi:hypothetical protein
MLHGKYLLMAAANDKPKKSEIFRQTIRWLIDFVFTFQNKRGEILDKPELLYADGFTCSSQEFYATVEQQMAARKIPGLEISRVKFAEGGLLSGQRVYLRLILFHPQGVCAGAGSVVAHRDGAPFFRGG